MSASVVLQTLERVALAMPGLLAVAVALFLGKVLFDRTHGFDENEELEDEQNTAFGVAYAAYFVGLAVAMVGALFQGGEPSIWLRTAKGFGQCVLVLVLMRASLWLNDRLILTRFAVQKEIAADRNVGVAFCVAGVLIATGLSLNGALTGFSQGFWATLRDILLFWAFGQLILIVGARLYQWTTPFDVHRVIELDDNVAVGLGFGGYLAALGVVARASLVGAGLDSLGNEILRTLTIAVLGVVLLSVIPLVLNLAFLKRTSLNAEISLENSLAMGALAMGGYLAAAILLAASLQR